MVRREPANYEYLSQVLLKKPRILHISCHGDYNESKREFYLAFEQQHTGILDKLGESRLQSLLDPNGNERLKLVFVSACHS